MFKIPPRELRASIPIRWIASAKTLSGLPRRASLPITRTKIFPFNGWNDPCTRPTTIPEADGVPDKVVPIANRQIVATRAITRLIKAAARDLDRMR